MSTFRQYTQLGAVGALAAIDAREADLSVLQAAVARALALITTLPSAGAAKAELDRLMAQVDSLEAQKEKLDEGAWKQFVSELRKDLEDLAARASTALAQARKKDRLIAALLGAGAAVTLVFGFGFLFGRKRR